jgi:hypothetical protein
MKNMKIVCKMKKAEILDRLRAQLCPEQVNKIFFFGTRQSFYRRRKSFQTLCLFSFFVRAISFSAASSRTENQNSRTFFGYSVVKYRKKQKGAATFKSLSRTRPSPLLKQFWIYFTNPLNFRVSGAETNRSRFSKILFPDGLNRRVSADNSDYQNPHTIRPTDFCLTASQ